MDTLQNLFTDDSVSETLRQKILDLIGDLARGGLQKEPVSGCRFFIRNR